MISTQPWYVDPQIYQTLKTTPPPGSTYVLIEGGPGDYQKVNALYQQSPVPGYYLGKVEMIHNPSFDRQFEGKVMVLNARADNPSFKAKWKHQDTDLPIRDRTDQALKSITVLNRSTYQHVQLFPAFHGTKASLLDSIFETGFANVATTDNGFFGKGIYNTGYAEYAHRVYSDGTLLFNWVCFYSAYPVAFPDVEKLKGGSNYSNYDAHYALVAPKNPSNSQEVIYYPITDCQNPTYDELVVFDSSHILPRYLITLAPDGIKLSSPVPQATGLTLSIAISVFFSEAHPSLQPLLQQQMTTLASQMMTPLNGAQHSLLVLIERSTGETDETIQLNLTERIAKLLESPGPFIPLAPQSPALPTIAPVARKEIHTLQGHKGWVSALAQLTDGTLASGSYDKTIKIWNPQTGVCIHTLKGHTGIVRTLAQLTDGTLASGSYDTTIKIWNPKTGACIHTLQGHTHTVTALAQLTDGTLASGSCDNTIKIWNLTTGACIHTLQGGTCYVQALAQLTDGTLVSGSGDKTIKIWNPTTGACIRTLQGHSVTALAPLTDGTLASGSVDKTIKIWNPTTGACIHTLQGHTDYIEALAPLTDGTLASGSADKTIKIWNPKTGVCIHTLKGHKSWVYALAQLADGTLASGSRDKTIKIWG